MVREGQARKLCISETYDRSFRKMDPLYFGERGAWARRGEGYLSLRHQTPSFHKTGRARERAREKEVDIPKDERVTPTSLNFES